MADMEMEVEIGVSMGLPENEDEDLIDYDIDTTEQNEQNENHEAMEDVDDTWTADDPMMPLGDIDFDIDTEENQYTVDTAKPTGAHDEMDISESLPVHDQQDMDQEVIDALNETAAIDTIIEVTEDQEMHAAIESTHGDPNLVDEARSEIGYEDAEETPDTLNIDLESTEIAEVTGSQQVTAEAGDHSVNAVAEQSPKHDDAVVAGTQVESSIVEVQGADALKENPDDAAISRDPEQSQQSVNAAEGATENAQVEPGSTQGVVPKSTELVDSYPIHEEVSEEKTVHDEPTQGEAFNIDDPEEDLSYEENVDDEEVHEEAVGEENVDDEEVHEEAVGEEKVSDDTARETADSCAPPGEVHDERAPRPDSTHEPAPIAEPATKANEQDTTEPAGAFDEKADEPSASHSEPAAEDREFPAVKVYYRDEEFNLFSTGSDGFFTDTSILNDTVGSLLGKLRVELAGDLAEQDEIVIQLDEVGLEFSESLSDAALSFTTLGQILEIFDLLVKNQDMDNTSTLHMYLLTRFCPSKRFEYLADSAAAGKGLGEVTFLFSAPSYAPSAQSADDPLIKADGDEDERADCEILDQAVLDAEDATLKAEAEESSVEADDTLDTYDWEAEENHKETASQDNPSGPEADATDDFDAYAGQSTELPEAAGNADLGAEPGEPSQMTKEGVASPHSDRNFDSKVNPAHTSQNIDQPSSNEATARHAEFEPEQSIGAYDDESAILSQPQTNGNLGKTEEPEPTVMTQQAETSTVSADNLPNGEESTELINEQASPTRADQQVDDQQVDDASSHTAAPDTAENDYDAEPNAASGTTVDDDFAEIDWRDEPETVDAADDSISVTGKRIRLEDESSLAAEEQEAKRRRS